MNTDKNVTQSQTEWKGVTIEELRFMRASALIRLEMQKDYLKRDFMFKFKSVVMDESAVNRALRRVSYEIIEKNRGTDNLCIVGICRRGVPLAEIIAENIKANESTSLPLGKLDITLYRDDVKGVKKDPVLNSTDIPFDITGKNIVLVDDVFYIYFIFNIVIRKCFSDFFYIMMMRFCFCNNVIK